MSKRNLFVSFAESDGGHSYLAARAMLDPGSIAHLIFRNTVAESLEAVGAGQANYAVVPLYNSITQWDGATIKALATGAFEIFGEVCMPTSYVLVAHKDYISEFLRTYASIKNVEDLTPEEEAKIYTRFLTRIFVGAQADEQYRGRLLRPDLTGSTVELSRNPLRVLEEQSRSDLVKQMMKANRPPTPGYPSNVSGGAITIAPPPAQSFDTVSAPAALVASGLLDAPGDPEGWDQPGSLGEIVSLLRKLLVLLNVYSFGSPDLPENKTSYLLVGRRGAGAPPADAIRSPAAAPTRIMTMVRPSLRKSSADQWMRPRNELAKKAREFGFVFDRPPVMVSPGNSRVFLFEGGRPKDGFIASPTGLMEWMFGWVLDLFMPPADTKGQPAGVKGKDKTLRKVLERKRDGELKDDTPAKYDTYFLGQYPTWCHGFADEACWCCDEAHADTVSDTGDGVGPLVQFLLASLIALTLLGLIAAPVYCMMTSACGFFSGKPIEHVLPGGPPPITQPVGPQTPPPVSPPAYPGLNGQKPAITAPPVHTPPTAEPVHVEPPHVTPIFPVSFYEDKANLTPEAANLLANAAAQAVQFNHLTSIELSTRAERRERDDALWSRRVRAVQDELVRLGVPRARIQHDASMPFVVRIRPERPPVSQSGKRASLELDTVPDPLSEN